MKSHTMGKWHAMGLIGIVAVLFLILRTGTGRPIAKPQDLPMLTIEETVGIAFFAGTPPCVMRRANPQARDTLFGILYDPSLAAFHLQAANSIGYVCQSSDISDIEDEIERRAAMPATWSAMNDKSVVSALCMALAIMDHQKIEGAAAALRSMAIESYWNNLGAAYYPPGGKKAVVTDADIYRSVAISAYCWTGRPDVQDVVTAALATTTGARRRSLDTSLHHQLKAASDSKGFFNKPCDEETHEKWVSGLQTCWNNDLDNPLPTASRRFAAED